MRLTLIAYTLLTASVISARSLLNYEENIAPLYIPPEVELVQDSFIVILKDHLTNQDIEQHAQWINTLTRQQAMFDWLSPQIASHGIEHVYDTPHIKGYSGHFDETILNAIRQSKDVSLTIIYYLY